MKIHIPSAKITKPQLDLLEKLFIEVGIITRAQRLDFVNNRIAPGVKRVQFLDEIPKYKASEIIQDLLDLAGGQ